MRGSPRMRAPGRHSAVHFSAVLLAAVAVGAAPPPDLPGEEITDEYIRQLVPRDSVVAHTPATSPSSPTWLDSAMTTWDAPRLKAQIGADKSFVPMGKGGIYVPRMTEGSLEPDVDILDTLGRLVARGRAGQCIAVLPGSYLVAFGSGSHQQLLVRETQVEESKLVPLVPDWSALTIEVVDEQNSPSTGHYELIRTDDFQPYGRGRGADPDLGEETQTWILRSGLYKILSVGDSYNTLRNFITVRLLPGHLTKVLLVIDEDDLKIVGGGVVDVSSEGVRDRLWRLGVDLGGSVFFNALIDRRLDDDRASNSSTIALLLNGWVRYNNAPWDWASSLRLDEGFTISDFDFSRIENSVDDARLRSLFIWRVLSWLGPYARFELQTGLFPKRERLDEGKSYFYVVEEVANQYRRVRVDSSSSIESEASFSPLTIEMGLGASLDVVDTRVFEASFRAGFGYSFSSVRDKLTPMEASSLDSATHSAYIDQGQVLRAGGNTIAHEAGPEAAIVLDLKLGGWALVRSELRWFAPVAPEMRIARPDLDSESTLSWRMARAVTLDYELKYTLKQPEQEDLRQDLVQHSIRVRFSLRTR